MGKATHDSLNAGQKQTRWWAEGRRIETVNKGGEAERIPLGHFLIFYWYGLRPPALLLLGEGEDSWVMVSDSLGDGGEPVSVTAQGNPTGNVFARF